MDIWSNLSEVKTDTRGSLWPDIQRRDTPDLMGKVHADGSLAYFRHAYSKVLTRDDYEFFWTMSLMLTSP